MARPALTKSTSLMLQLIRLGYGYSSMAGIDLKLMGTKSSQFCDTTFRSGADDGQNTTGQMPYAACTLSTRKREA